VLDQQAGPRRGGQRRAQAVAIDVGVSEHVLERPAIDAPELREDALAPGAAEALDGESPIGRGPECTIRISSPRVSRRHARILVNGPRATLEDLGSKNGTYLEGRVIEGPRRLADGDEITVGSAVFVFRAVEATGTTRSDRRPRPSGEKA
jgi:hypothetical protein